MTTQHPQELSSRSYRGSRSRSPSRVQKLAALANLSPAAATALHRLPAMPTSREPPFGTVASDGRTPGGRGGVQYKRASRHSCCSEENVHSLGSASRLSRCSTWCSTCHESMHTAASPEPPQLQRSFSQQAATSHPDPGHPIQQAGAAPLAHLLQPGHMHPLHQESSHPHSSRACPSSNSNHRQNHQLSHVCSTTLSSCSASESGHTEGAAGNTAAAPPATPFDAAAAGQISTSRPLFVHDHLAEQAPTSAASARSLLLRSMSSTAGYVDHAPGTQDLLQLHSGGGASGNMVRLKLQASRPGRRTSQPAIAAVRLDVSPLHALRSSPAVRMASHPATLANPECCLVRWTTSFSSTAGPGGGALHAALSCTLIDSLPGSTSSNFDLSCVDGVSDATVHMLDPGQAVASPVWGGASSSAVRLSQQRDWSRAMEPGQGEACSCKQDAGRSRSISLTQTSERHSRPALAQAGGSVDMLRSSRRRPSSVWTTGELGRLSAWEPGQVSSSQGEDLNSAGSSVLPPQPHGLGVPQQPDGAAATRAAGAVQPSCRDSASAKTSSAATAATSTERSSPVTTERNSSCQLGRPPYSASSSLDDMEEERRASDDSACSFGLLVRLFRRIAAKKQDS